MGLYCNHKVILKHTIITLAIHVNIFIGLIPKLEYLTLYAATYSVNIGIA